MAQFRATALIFALTIPGCAGPGPGLVPLGVGPDALIRFHLVSEVDGPGLETREFEGETLHLERELIASDPDLIRPRLSARDGTWTLDVRFSLDGGVRFDETTYEDAGRRAALLIDSRVRELVTVRPQLGASRILVSMEISDDEATQLREAIDARWP